jgi:hypothetical protein
VVVGLGPTGRLGVVTGCLDVTPYHSGPHTTMGCPLRDVSIQAPDDGTGPPDRGDLIEARPPPHPVGA